jgi:F-type H+-transporting ATPase subunit delta
LSKNKGFSITSADRYSLALYELASENSVLSQVEDQSLSILSLISSSKDFSNLIKDPTNSQEDLLKVLDNISNDNKFENLLKNFLSFLITKRRFFYVEQILKSFIETCSKKRGELKAELKSAKELWWIPQLKINYNKSKTE